ncbi:insulin-like growth factor [Anabrus simplex]|uniref:insulin-like growth factor n=1 Tax=Anabrus simplex TaxID=316456 RepID=UPI0035A36217
MGAREPWGVTQSITLNPPREQLRQVNSLSPSASELSAPVRSVHGQGARHQHHNSQSAPDAMLCRCHLLLLAALVTTTSCHPAGLIRVCGYQLANEIAKVCKGRGYNDPFSHVTLADGTNISHRRSTDSSSESHGLANDCCYRGCTRNEMEQYCSPAPPNSRSSLSSPEDTNRGVAATPSRSEQAADMVERTTTQTTTTPAPPRFRLGEVNPYYA